MYLFPKLFDPAKSISEIRLSLSNEVYLKVIRDLALPNVSTDLVVKPVAFQYARPCNGDDNDDDWTEDYVAALDQLVGDALFTCSVVNFARTYAQQVRTSTCRFLDLLSQIAPALQFQNA
jgi:hypothetical protein